VVLETPTLAPAREQAMNDERVPELTHYKYTPLDANKDPPADAGTPAR